MKFCIGRNILFVVLSVVLTAGNTYATTGKLSPQDFNKMYYLASQGKIGVLREAVGRGLNIDSTNPNGDTGLCIAIKRNDYIAYNSFRMSGANPKHACTYRMHDDYQKFLDSNKTVHVDKVLGNEESLYYNEKDRSWWPWILGGAVIGGGALALSSGGGGGGKSTTSTVVEEEPVTETVVYMGLTSYLDVYEKLISSVGVENSENIDGSNPDAASVVNKINLLPNILSNTDYLRAYAKVVNGMYYYNLPGGSIRLGNAAVGLAAFGSESKVMNDGSIEIEARNGAIGMAASNGSQALNGVDTGVSGSTSNDGSISMVFKGSQTGDAVIGMYGDTSSEIVNYGKISGTATAAVEASDEEDSDSSGILVDETSSAASTGADNSGTMIGMSVFDFYTGTDLSTSTVSAKNYGDIKLWAGYNNASGVSVSLIGMGSYLDDNFLNGVNSPALAEQMKLLNLGNIELSYQGVYSLSSEALRLGNGGLVGMRSDAMTQAVNQGNISIDMQATNIASGVEAAAGMLSVHGGDLVNGIAGAAYDGTGTNTGGTISIVNEASSGGVYYGMLAAKGSGAQTGLYKWKAPNLVNYGLIDMQVSNAFGMATYTGGTLINEGVINLGSETEKGQSYYHDNYGLYAAGAAIAEQGALINKGIINVYSENSTAIYNAFSGAVDMRNDGTIYISNKATDSVIFGGNYSEATNNGTILYKAGNSDNVVFPPQTSLPGGNLGLGEYLASSAVIGVATDSETPKRLFTNDEDGILIIGEQEDRENKDYGGTYGTVGVMVSNQGAAVNKGTIHLVKYNDTQAQYNQAMVLDEGATVEAYLYNSGSIIIDSIGSGGMVNMAKNNTNVVNFGQIYVNGKNNFGIAAGQAETNIYNGRADMGVNDVSAIYVGSGAVGMVVIGEEYEPPEDPEAALDAFAQAKKSYGYNYGTIYLQGSGAAAFYLPYETGIIEVRGDIVAISGYSNMSAYLLGSGKFKFDEQDGSVLKGYSLARVINSAKVELSEDSLVTLDGENSGLFISEGEGTEASNLGKVEVLNGASALKAIEGGNVVNQGDIVIAGGSGMTAESGTAVNLGEINVIDGIGIDVSGGYAENIGSINIIDGNGVSITGEGRFVNQKDGEITVLNGKAIAVQGESAAAINDGTIKLSENGSVYVGDNGTFSNNGLIIYSGEDEKSGDFVSAGKIIEVENNGTFVNDGVVEFSDKAVDFGEGDSFVLSGNGTYRAESFSGNVALSKNIVVAGFEDVYTNQNAFEGKNQGLSVSSQSYMFDASLTDNGDETSGVELTRKDFRDLVEDRDLAEFFETNYQIGNNEKMFGALKSAADEGEFSAVTESESGKKFYANLARENMAVLRGLNADEQNRILEDGLDGGSIGAGYFRTGKDGADGLSGYADDVYSIYGTYGKKLNNRWSAGATLKAAYVDAQYDDIDSSRENKILAAFLPILYQNGGYRFLSMPGIGVGYGEYKRRAVSGVYDADTLDFYYGVYNHAEYSVDMKVAELVGEAELNLQGISMTKAKEKGGLNLGSNDAVSLEAGIGVKLRKRFELAKKRSLMLAVGTKYYHEFLDPYKDLNIGMNGSPVTYSVKGYDENKNRLKTTAEAVYKDGDFSVAAEIAHNAEKESNIEGGVGVWYNF